jgi:hypothetical protein
VPFHQKEKVIPSFQGITNFLAIRVIRKEFPKFSPARLIQHFDELQFSLLLS